MKHTYILNINQSTVTIVLDFNMGMCTIYSASGKIILKRTHMKGYELNDIKKSIDSYMDDEKSVSSYWFKRFFQGDN